MADTVVQDTTSWKEIEVTFYFTAATSCLFLLVFEVARRRPAFAAVFDRRRSYYAKSTTLQASSSSSSMQDRHDDNDEDPTTTEGSGKTMPHSSNSNSNNNNDSMASSLSTTMNRIPPPLLDTRLFEWLFVSTDPAYTAYADLVHTQHVVRERKQQQHETLLLVTKRKRDTRSTQPSPTDALDAPPSVTSMARGDATNGTNAEGDTTEVDLEALSNHNTKTNQRGQNRRPSTATPTAASSSSSVSMVVQARRAALTPDVVHVNGRRLHVSVTQQEKVWDLTEEQLIAYEQQLLAREADQERDLYERYQTMILQQEHARNVQRNKAWFARGPTATTTTTTTTTMSRSADVEGGHANNTALDVSNVKPPSRWRYIGWTLRTDREIDSADTDAAETSVRVAGTRGFLAESPTSTLALAVDPNDLVESENNDKKRRSSSGMDYKAKNRYLKSFSDKVTRPLSRADEELLRCVGLDAYVMLRFLRFGFDVTFYPFLLACVSLIPVYYTNDFDGDGTLDTSGYFQFTFNRLERQSNLIWVAWVYAMLFFSYILYRMWVEWETFISLRSDFLANGDAEMDAAFVDNQGSFDGIERQNLLVQYRNSCLVEYVPASHQSDQELFDFFDAIFPGQVKRAEILMKADSLTKLIAKRQALIELHEDTYASYFHVHQKHRRKVDYLRDREGSLCQILTCRSCRGMPKQPLEPTVKLSGFCCCRKTEKALKHYLSEIKILNKEINVEHARISEAKQKVADNAGKQNLLSRTLDRGYKMVTNHELTCNTGFVEFKNLCTKQSAIQCKITGTTKFMTTSSAPDPRDINWDNASESRQAIDLKRRKCEFLLLVGTFFWFFAVAFVTSISNLDRLDDFLPSYLIPKADTYWYGVVQGYLPVVALELLMYLVPLVIRALATRYIRLKTKSDVDKFVFKWHFAYRLANLIIIIVKNQLYETLTLESATSDIRGAVDQVAEGIALSSQFFLNNMIIAAGTETMWELAQMPSMIVHFITYRVVTVEAKSKRALERLEQPGTFEWGDTFPPFIFAFLIATVYATIVPLVLGVCAVFFYFASKVFTHQALFVYAQPYEGGGKLMYLLNRTLFTIMYIAIAIFAMLLGLKEGKYEAPTFFVSMIVLTMIVDWKIQTKFVVPSISLNLTNARIIDNETQSNEDRMQRRRQKRGKGGNRADTGDDDAYLYRQPQLNKSLWETEPRPYR